MANRVQPGYFGDRAYAQWRQQQQSKPGMPLQPLNLAAYKPDDKLRYTPEDAQNFRNFGGHRIETIEDAAIDAGGKSAQVKKDGKLTQTELALYLASREKNRIEAMMPDCAMDEALAHLTERFFQFHDVNGDHMVDEGEMAGKTMLETNIAGSLDKTLAAEEKAGGSKAYTRAFFTNVLRKGYPNEIAWVLYNADLTLDEEEKKVVALIAKQKTPQGLAAAMANNEAFAEAVDTLWGKVHDEPKVLDKLKWSDFKKDFAKSGLIDGRYFTEVGRTMVEQQWFNAPDCGPSVDLAPLLRTTYNNNQLQKASPYANHTAIPTTTTDNHQNNHLVAANKPARGGNNLLALLLVGLGIAGATGAFDRQQPTYCPPRPLFSPQACFNPFGFQPRYC